MEKQGRSLSHSANESSMGAPVLSFRTKLVLAMMLVVAGVTVATLYVTQRRVQANYGRMFRKQFDWQINYFTSLQDARREVVKDQCLKLSQSVRLIAAMNERPDRKSVV